MFNLLGFLIGKSLVTLLTHLRVVIKRSMFKYLITQYNYWDFFFNY